MLFRCVMEKSRISGVYKEKKKARMIQRKTILQGEISAFCRILMAFFVTL